MSSCPSFVFVVAFAALLLFCVTATSFPANSSKPVWWKSYRKKFGKKHIKRCLFLQDGEIPVHGAACPSVDTAGSASGWYMCLFGSDQTCSATTGPLPGMSGVTGVGLGGVHPSMKCTCLNMVWSCDEWKPCCAPTNVYRSTSGAFDVELPLFSKDVIKGYDSETKLDSALMEAAKFFINQVIETQRAALVYFYVHFPLHFAPPQSLGAVYPSSFPSASGQTAFETNNQEVDVDEADAVKSDGKYVYVAYGDVVVVWNALTGEMITNVTMPAIETPPEPVSTPAAAPVTLPVPLPAPLPAPLPSPLATPFPSFLATQSPSFLATQSPSASPSAVPAPFATLFPAPVSAPVSASAATPFAAPFADFSFGGSPFTRPYYQPRPNIRSLLLESNRLIVIVAGYGNAKRAKMNITSSVFMDLYGTHVRVYDTSTLTTSGQLTFIKEVDINGSFQDARAIGTNIHIVSSTAVNTWSWLSNPLQQSSGNFDQNLTEAKYTAQAIALSKDKLIPAFVKQLKDDMNLLGGPKLVGISLWESVLSGMEEHTFSGGVFQAYSQVSSFSATDADLKLSLAGSFMPVSGGYTYSTTDMLIFSASGWDWLPARQATGPTTYFLGMKLVGATATPAAIGSIPGSLLNQYSLDIFEDHLRVATNIPTVWRWPVFDGSSESFVPIQESSSQNQVVILKIPSVVEGGEAGVFTEVGRIANLGKEGESFTAVRFFDNVAYAVTFEKTDPFYVLDLDVSNPRVLGELEITGFSSYLHSINADNTLILAIGEEADTEGQVLGLKIALFDSTDPTKPILLQSYTVEQQRDAWSSSAVSWDFKAFRYLPLASPEVGILIIPVQVLAPYPSKSGNFDGFITYDVSRQGISLRGEIPHVESNQFYGCFSNAYLPQRSLVFNGNVTTLKGHSVLSTDLDTFKKTWELQLDDGFDKSQGCYFWLY